MYKNTEGVIEPRQVIMALTNAAMYVIRWQKTLKFLYIYALSHFEYHWNLNTMVIQVSISNRIYVTENNLIGLYVI